MHTVVGNGKVFGDTIQNFTSTPYRRVDRTAQLPHGVDIGDAIYRLKTRLALVPHVEQAPAPDVELLDFNPMGPVLAVRPYTNNAYYWQVYFDTNKVIAEEFGGRLSGAGDPDGDAAGLTVTITVRARFWSLRLPASPAPGMRTGAGGRWHRPLATGSPSALDRLRPCTSDEGPTDAYCGPRVFENREAAQGRTIALNIVVLPALGNDRRPDPLFFLAGGPGQGPRRWRATCAALPAGAGDRDIVLVDQRGTGKSNPLDCRSTTTRSRR